MKKFWVVLIALAVVLFASCASAKFGGEKVPEWVITEPESTTADIYATGSGKNADLDMALKMAKADAMNNLAKKVALQVNDTVQTTTVAGNAGSGTSRKYEEDATQTTDTVLKKADVVDYFQLKNGTVYVLMHMPLEQLD